MGVYTYLLIMVIIILVNFLKNCQLPINCLVRYITILCETLPDSKTLFLRINFLPYFASTHVLFLVITCLCLCVFLSVYPLIIVYLFLCSEHA